MGNLDSNISNLRETKRILEVMETRLKNESKAVGTMACRKAAEAIQDMYGTVEGATKNSNVGSRDCLSALESAYNKTKTIRNLLNADCAMRGLSSGGSGTGDMIHVTYQIPAVRINIHDAVQDIENCRRQMRNVQIALSATQLSKDMTVFESVDSEFIESKMAYLSNSLTTYQNILRQAWNEYREAQVKAIARARSIPK